MHDENGDGETVWSTGQFNEHQTVWPEPQSSLWCVTGPLLLVAGPLALAPAVPPQSMSDCIGAAALQRQCLRPGPCLWLQGGDVLFLCSGEP